MSEIEDRKELSSFIDRRRTKKPVSTLEVKDTQANKTTPWFRRPLTEVEFSYKLAKNGRYYVRHKEWNNRTWIGPYRNVEDVNAIIESYVVESLKGPLDKKYDENIHSVVIDNPEVFF